MPRKPQTPRKTVKTDKSVKPDKIAKPEKSAKLARTARAAKPVKPGKAVEAVRSPITARRSKPESSAFPDLPAKPFFRIGEVAALVGVKAHVLRFWEREFPSEIRPERSASNQRVYGRAHVEAFLRIRALRHGEGLRLEGARRRLRTVRGDEPAPIASLISQARAAIDSLLEAIDEDESLD